MTLETEYKTTTRSHITFSNNMMQAMQEWQEILQILTEHNQGSNINQLGEKEISLITESFTNAISNISSDPDKMLELSTEMWNDYSNLWQSSAQKLMGQYTETTKGETSQTHTTNKDRRFKDEAWQNIPFFDFMRQSYNLGSKWMHKIAEQADKTDKHNAKKLNFYTRQLIDAMSPSNFPMTNPEVMRATLENNGENLLRGMKNMRRDIEQGNGNLRIKTSDNTSFNIGKNLATTDGEVIYQNDLMQLIQYAPQTSKVHSTPLLLIPAWINKYYVLDMQKENSFINWLVEQGHTVFVISWVNPTEAHRNKRFEDYMTEGVLESLSAIEKQTGTKQTSVIGYCLGGTLLACTLAYLHAKGEQQRVASATYLTTMIDFSNAGELSIFIDDEQISEVEAKMKDKGYLEGYEMANSFNMLRANDLIWSFFINNYLLGKSPFPFDLLYWNADSTRMPAKMHSFYLRNMYQRNLLIKDGGIELAGVPINIKSITTPTYILACHDDHIAPWQSTYAATKLYQGDVTFTLSASGHIAGVINPPSKNKYCHWTNSNTNTTAEDWLSNATEHSGSWWTNWNEWQQKYAGTNTPKRLPTKGNLPIIEHAPGEYVKACA